MQLTMITPRERFASFTTLKLPDSDAERAQFFINYWAYCLNYLKETTQQRGLSLKEYLGYAVPDYIEQQVYNGPDTQYVAWCLPQLGEWDSVTWEIFLGVCYDAQDITIVSPASLQLFGRQTYTVRGEVITCENYHPEGLQKNLKYLQLTLSDFSIEQPWKSAGLDIKQQWAKRLRKFAREGTADDGLVKAGIIEGLAPGVAIDKERKRAAFKAARAAYVEKLRIAQEQWHNAVQHKRTLEQTMRASNKRVNALPPNETMLEGMPCYEEAKLRFTRLRQIDEERISLLKELRSMLGQQYVATAEEVKEATVYANHCKAELDAVKAEGKPSLHNFTV